MPQVHRAIGNPIDRLLEDVRREVGVLDGGEVATYIPELAKADASVCGLAVATLDGHLYTAGELVPFTIQSVSKPFVYALALTDSGAEAVLAKVGAEPTGDPFNTISLDDVTIRAHNPMVNAGAIVTTTLVGGATREEQFARVLDGLSAFAGRALTVDEAVFESERATGDRNRAIAYLMRSANLLDEDVEQQIDNYFRQCSIVVTAQDLAVMTATLANAGVNPLTGVEVIPRHVVASVLTVMATCGMYDYSGEWLYRVGLPAKSGVSGAVAAVLPGQLGLAAHSPRLDPQGNSVRGVAACERISERLGLHLLLPGERVRSGLRRSYRADTARSRRLRDQRQRDVLDAHGSSIVVYELGGDEAFAAVEPLVRVVLGDDDAQWVVIDMRRVTRIDTAALTLLDGLIAQLAAAGHHGRDRRAARPRPARRPARARSDPPAVPRRGRGPRMVRDPAAPRARARQHPARGDDPARAAGPPAGPARRDRDRDRGAGHHQGLPRRHGGLRGGRRRPTASTSSAPARWRPTSGSPGAAADGASARSPAAPPSASSPSSTAGRDRRASSRSSPRSASSSRPRPSTSCGPRLPMPAPASPSRSPAACPIGSGTRPLTSPRSNRPEQSAQGPLSRPDSRPRRS